MDNIRLLHSVNIKSIDQNGLLLEAVGITNGHRQAVFHVNTNTISYVRPDKEMMKRFDDALPYLQDYRKFLLAPPSRHSREVSLMAFRTAICILDGDVETYRPPKFPGH